VKSLLGWLHLSLSSVNCILCPLALQAMRTHSTVDSFGHTCNSDLYSTRTPVTSLDLTPLFFNRPQTTIHHNKAHHIFFPLRLFSNISEFPTVCRATAPWIPLTRRQRRFSFSTCFVIRRNSIPRLFDDSPTLFYLSL